MFEPEYESLVDLFMSEHAEIQLSHRFPKLRLRSNFKVMCSYNESPTAAPCWAIPMHGGYLIGHWMQAKSYSTIKAIFIVTTALYEWQYKRSQFTKKKFVQVEIRRINSKIQNKLKDGKICKKESVDASKAVSKMASDVRRQNLPNTSFVPGTSPMHVKEVTLQYQTPV